MPLRSVGVALHRFPGAERATPLAPGNPAPEQDITLPFAIRRRCNTMRQQMYNDGTPVQDGVHHAGIQMYGNESATGCWPTRCLPLLMQGGVGDHGAVAPARSPLGRGAFPLA